MNPESIFSFFFTLGFRSGLWSQGKVDYLITEKQCACLLGPTLKTLVSYGWRKYIKKKLKQGTSKPAQLKSKY